MNQSEILKAYDFVAGKSLPKLEAACFGQTTREIAQVDKGNVWKQIKAFSPQSGWIMFQTQVVWFGTAEQLPNESTVLAAELAGKNDNSLHIRQDGVGGWILAELAERSDGKEMLVENVSLLSEIDDGRKLNYKVYWAKDELQGYMRSAARFVGFSKGRE